MTALHPAWARCLTGALAATAAAGAMGCGSAGTDGASSGWGAPRSAAARADGAVSPAAAEARTGPVTRRDAADVSAGGQADGDGPIARRSPDAGYLPGDGAQDASRWDDVTASPDAHGPAEAGPGRSGGAEAGPDDSGPPGADPADTGPPDAVPPNDPGGAPDLGPAPDTGPAAVGGPEDPIDILTLPFVTHDDTATAPSSAISGYDCAASTPEGGPERIYRLELPSAATVRIDVMDGPGVDVDVHLLSALAVGPDGVATGCLGRHDRSLVLEALPAGTYYVVADTYGAGASAAGPYTLAVEVQIPDVWQEVPLAPGVVWRQKVYSELFGGRQTVNVLSVQPGVGGARVRPWKGTGCVRPSAAGAAAGALAALNGGFFDTGGGCPSLDLVKIGGVVHATNHLTGAAQASLGIDAAGWPHVAPIEPGDGWGAVVHALGGHPQLVSDGLVDIWEDGSGGFYTARHPRTAAGVTADGELLLVTVDGRTEAGVGMTIAELAWFMVALGAEVAVNLDGGGSTTLWVPGMSVNGIVSFPSDNGVADHGGERAVSDGLLLMPP